MRFLRSNSIVLTCVLLMSLNISYSDNSHENKQKASLSGKDKPWRVGYCESESFINYADTLYGILKGLDELGHIDGIENMDHREGQNDTEMMWKWLTTNDVSEKFHFVGDAWYSLTVMEEYEKEKMVQRFNEGDLDLIIVMGTSAGKYIAEHEFNTSVMVFATSNAVQSGIVASETDSGSRYVWAHMDSGRFRRQIDVFYDMFEFKTLGLVYENSPVARDYSAVEDVLAAGREKGFRVVTRFVDEPVSVEDRERYFKEVKTAYRSLSEQVDAFYITVASLESEWLPELLEPFYKNGVPVFSQLGEIEVKNGALMSITVNDYKNIGRFGADYIVRFFNGESFREMSQVFESTPQIIINLDVAEKIGYKVPFEVLLSADKIYRDTGDINETEQ